MKSDAGGVGGPTGGGGAGVKFVGGGVMFGFLVYLLPITPVLSKIFCADMFGQRMCHSQFPKHKTEIRVVQEEFLEDERAGRVACKGQRIHTGGQRDVHRHCLVPIAYCVVPTPYNKS